MSENRILPSFWIGLHGQDMTFCLIDDHTYSTLQDIAFEVFETPEQHGGRRGNMDLINQPCT